LHLLQSHAIIIVEFLLKINKIEKNQMGILQGACKKEDHLPLPYGVFKLYSTLVDPNLNGLG
jgi:hypothetical protein